MFIEKTRIKTINEVPNLSFSSSRVSHYITIQEGIEIYIKWKQSYAAIAAQRYLIRLEQFANYLGKDNLLINLTSSHLAEFHSNMQSQFGYAPGTVAFSIRILKDFISYWNGRQQCNIQLKEIRNIRYVTPEKEMLSEKEFKLLRDNLDERFYEDLIVKLVFNLLWDTGCRISELCELEISDIIDSKVEGLRCAKIRRRKTMRYNVISWSKETNRLLNLFLGIRLCMDIPTDRVLITRKNKPLSITPRTIQRWCHKYTKLAGINKKITPHSFRHSKAHRIINQSQNVRDVQAILGHRSPASSFNYLNLNIDGLIQTSLKYL